MDTLAILLMVDGLMYWCIKVTTVTMQKHVFYSTSFWSRDLWSLIRRGLICERHALRTFALLQVLSVSFGNEIMAKSNLLQNRRLWTML